MKEDYQMQDFWIYVAKIQDEVTKEVLEQVKEDEYFTCVRLINDYMFNLRAMHMDRIWAMNNIRNKYVRLINEALGKRNIYIAPNYIHISIC